MSRARRRNQRFQTGQPPTSPADLSDSIRPGTVFVTAENGESVITAHGVALIFGVSVEQVADLETYPAEWMANGRRRCQEAAQVSGSDDLVGALRYWAKRDLGIELCLEAVQ